MKCSATQNDADMQKNVNVQIFLFFIVILVVVVSVGNNLFTGSSQNCADLILLLYCVKMQTIQHFKKNEQESDHSSQQSAA